MALKTRIERLECLQGMSAEPVRIVDCPFENDLTIDEWVVFCKEEDERYRLSKLPQDKG